MRFHRHDTPHREHDFDLLGAEAGAAYRESVADDSPFAGRAMLAFVEAWYGAAA